MEGYSTLKNCTVTGNVASEEGGGAFGAYLYNCALDRNRADRGGGAGGWLLYFPSVLNNCTLTGNSARWGGGTSGSVLNNCIGYYNEAAYGSNYYDSTLAYSCSTPLPPGAGNLADEPQLASLSHLSGGSPCREKGNAEFTTGVDLDGEPWANPPSVGCDQYSTGSITGGLSVVIGGVCTGLKVDLYAAIEGRVSASRWEFGDGTIVSNQPWISRVYSAPGNYPVALRAYNESYPTGVVGTFVANLPVVHYVALESTNPVAPYTNWATAASDMNVAIDAAGPGALILVGDGVYKTGGRSIYQTSNRVAITKPVTVRSLNGPAVTHIVGAGPNGAGAVRCVYLTNGAALAGFTLTNGATLATGWNTASWNGGGAWCDGTNALLSNCLITGNSSAESGGGVYGGTLDACLLKNNSALSQGGGAAEALLKNCLLTGNAVTGPYLVRQGGGAVSSTLLNCVLTDNSAPDGGGGAAWSYLVNCVIIGNSVAGTVGCDAVNTVIYYNSPQETFPDLQYFRHCCLTPLLPGSGNFTNAPLFVNTNGWSNLRLQPNSACINAGKNRYLTNSYLSFTNSLDLDGNQRIAAGTVDVGAYEFQSPASSLSYVWLQQYGLPTDGSADTADNDMDGLNNWQEWIADTIPTDSSSALRLLCLSNSLAGTTATWSSVRSRNYTLERAPALQITPVFEAVGTNIEGLVGATTFTDTNATGLGPFLYRVRTAGQPW